MTPSLRPARPTDLVVLERLWLLFRHEMSAFSGALPNPDGTYRRERLDAALADPTWCAYVLRLGDAPVGLAIVRSLDREPRVLNSFFIVHGVRRTGLGSWAVRALVEQHPGRWEVAFQEANAAAGAFWRRVVASLDATYADERRDVPGRPDLPPDTWLRFGSS